MIDTDKYERTTPELEEFEGETLGDTLTNLIAEVKRLREENLKLRKVLRKKANKIRAWNKLYKYHNELENDSQHHWEMRELMDTIMNDYYGDDEE